jgi:hypothetical protein
LGWYTNRFLQLNEETMSVQENFTTEHEMKSYRILAILGVVLTVLFVAFGFFEVPNVVGSAVWYVFALATAAGSVTFFLAGAEPPRGPAPKI